MQAFFERMLETHGKSFAVAFGMGLLIALLVLTPTAGAQPSQAVDRAERLQAQAEQRAADRAERSAQRAEQQAERQELRENRLTEKKLEICEKRQAKIQNIMARIADRGEKHLDVFTKISDRTQEFYVAKNLSVANYDELVANVEEKKASAEAQVELVRTTSTEFTCDGVNPTGVASLFKDDMQAQIAALKDYRTAVKDLIVGIRAVAEAEETDETTESTDENTGDETTTEEETTRVEDETTEGGTN